MTLSSGQISFNQSTFESAFTANPTQVANLFTQGGGYTPSSSTYTGGVNFSYASPTTQAGNYDVTISQSATQATDAGTVQSGATVGTPRRSRSLQPGSA